MRPGQIDLLLSVETITGTRDFVYILVEHKSWPERWVTVQLLRYVAGLLHQWRTLPLPRIHPVVVYHGPRRWTVRRRLTGLHRSGDSHAIELRYHLLDLSGTPVRRLATTTRIRAYTGLLTFKYVMKRLPTERMRELFRTTMDPALPPDPRRLLWHCILTSLPSESVDETVHLMKEISYAQREGELVRCVADVLRERGVTGMAGWIPFPPDAGRGCSGTGVPRY